MPKLIKNVITTYIPAAGGSYTPPMEPAWSFIGSPTATSVWSETTVSLSADGSVRTTFGVPNTVTITTENVLVYYPPTGAVPAAPSAPPTAAQTIVSLNQGWNSYARTIDRLLPGTYIEFTVKYGSYGALLAVGLPAMEGMAPQAFPYGVLVDTSGVYSFESGSQGLLAASNAPGMLIRIARLSDGRIVYSIGGVAVKISAVTTYGLTDELYVYGLLYSGGDEVTTSEFKEGNLISEPSVTMRGRGDLTVQLGARAAMAGAGDLLVALYTAVTMSGKGEFTGTLSTKVSFIDATLSGSGNLASTLDSGGRAFFTLAPLQFLASDTESENIGTGYTELPLFTFDASENVFVPAQPTTGYFNLPFYTMWADGTETDIGAGSIDLPQYQFIAAEGEYGTGSLDLPKFFAGGHGGFTDADEIILFSTALAQSQQTQAIDLVMILDSAGNLTSTLSLTREQALALMSSLSQLSNFSMLGVYGMSAMSGIRGMSLAALNIGSGADLNDAGAVWVVNLDSNASVQYEQYGFNSFFQRGNDYYGVANDGIYKLSGATDNGAQIDALVEFAKSNFGIPQDKTMPNVYLSASSDGALVLKVVTGTNTLFYTARSSSPELDKHRVDLGRGLQGMYWQFSVMNENGDDFNVAGMEFLPIASKRRI